MRDGLRDALPFAGLGAVLVLAVAFGMAVQPPGTFGWMPDEAVGPFVAWAGLAGAAYLGGVLAVRYGWGGQALGGKERGSKERGSKDRGSKDRGSKGWGGKRMGGALPVILAAGLAARLIVLVHPPALSNDIYRYVWDGRVQAAGINPYRYLPVDPALAPLRDRTPGDVPSATAIYPNVNRADYAPTIYPPAAQALFALVGVTASSLYGMKGAMLLLDAVTGLAGLLMLRAARRPAAQLVLWAWNPLFIWEFSGAGHIDALACAFVALALLAAIRTRMGWAGIAMGAAVITKFLPALIFPAVWRRWDLRSPIAAAAVIVAGYAAYAGVGLKVFGFLAGYTREEDLQSGNGYFLIRLLGLAGEVPRWVVDAYIVTGLAMLVAAALLIVRKPLPIDPAARAVVIGRGAAIMAGLMIAVLSPHFPWYLTILGVPAIIYPAWSTVWVTIAAPMLYLDAHRYDIVWTNLTFLPVVPLLGLDIYAARNAPALALAALPSTCAEGTR